MGKHSAPGSGCIGYVIAFFAMAITAITFAVISLTSASAAPTNHYTRPNVMVIQTRRNGAWTARCHAVHILKNGTDTIYAAGGCLPPKHS